MLLLASTSALLEVVTASAVTVDVHASYVDNASGTITPDSKNTAITTAATTTIVPSPSGGTQRNIQTVIIRNKHASSAVLVTVRHYDGTVTSELIQYNLAAGQQLVYIDGDGWEVIDAAGQVLQSPNQVPAGVVPVGGIVMWSGTIATIPATWALCDGTANAPGPDLRNKFVVGATQDDAGVPKTNIRGSLEQSATATGHSHSAHANLTHTGASVADHTGLTHGVTIANHPDLTHPALSHAAITITHADHSVASFTGSIASRADLSMPSHSHA